MLNRLPDRTPTLSAMLGDIGSPTPAAVAKALGVSVGTVQRWLRADEAPRPALLAVFWLTRWGQSAVHCEAHNAAVMHAGMADALRHEIKRLEAQLARLGRIADFGSANDPAPALGYARPALPVVPVPGEPARPKARSTTRQKTSSTKQPRGFQRG